MLGVFLFHTTSAAFRAERVLKEGGLTVKLIPTPRQLSSDCGVALQIHWREAGRAEALLTETGVEYAAVHQMPS